MDIHLEKITDYELLDSGEEEKLERFGAVVLSRPDPGALWRKNNPSIWSDADALFVRYGKQGEWKKKSTLPESWNIDALDLKLLVKPTSFKHVGVFPEQIPHWKWMQEKIVEAKNKNPDRTISVLNVFAYTGGATLACAKAGAEVTHVDGSKASVQWARDNAELSGLVDAPIRWIIDDAMTFIKREIKRGKKYDGIVMDPPAFGHGPNDELWKIKEHFLPLFDLIRELLSDNPLFVLVSGYAAGYSSVALSQNMNNLVSSYGGELVHGELFIQESTERKFLLSAGIYARLGK